MNARARLHGRLRPAPIRALKTKRTDSASSHAALLSLPASINETERQHMNRSIVTRTLVATLALAFAGTIPLTATTAHAAGNESDHPVTDTWITTKVKAELATTDGVKSTNVDVKTIDGVVTLTGVLTTPLAVKKAIAAAESVQGVKKVDHSGLKSQ
jgi:hyperosmotically inducible periplasmic protein